MHFTVESNLHTRFPIDLIKTEDWLQEDRRHARKQGEAEMVSAPHCQCGACGAPRIKCKWKCILLVTAQVSSYVPSDGTSGSIYRYDWESICEFPFQSIDKVVFALLQLLETDFPFDEWLMSWAWLYAMLRWAISFWLRRELLLLPSLRFLITIELFTRGYGCFLKFIKRKYLWNFHNHTMNTIGKNFSRDRSKLTFRAIYINHTFHSTRHSEISTKSWRGEMETFVTRAGYS